jgi:hypothetical protein
MRNCPENSFIKIYLEISEKMWIQKIQKVTFSLKIPLKILKLKSLKIHANKIYGENVSIVLEACIRKS